MVYDAQATNQPRVLRFGEEERHRLRHEFDIRRGHHRLIKFRRLDNPNQRQDFLGAVRQQFSQIIGAHLVLQLLEQRAAQPGIVLTVQPVERQKQQRGVRIIMYFPDCAVGRVMVQFSQRLGAVVAIQNLKAIGIIRMPAHNQRRIIAGAGDVGLQFREQMRGHAIGVRRMRIEMVECKQRHGQ